MSSEGQDFRNKVRIFIENQADNFDLTIYDISLLKVIAEYCDMPLGYCCLCYSKLERFSRMGETQRRKSINHLIAKKIISRSYVKGKPRFNIGDLIINKTYEYD